MPRLAISPRVWGLGCDSEPLCHVPQIWSTCRAHGQRTICTTEWLSPCKWAWLHPTLCPGWMPAKWSSRRWTPSAVWLCCLQNMSHPLLFPIPSHQGEGVGSQGWLKVQAALLTNAPGRGPSGSWGSRLPPAFPWVLRSDCQSAPYLCISLTLLVTTPLWSPWSPARR